MLGIFLIAIVLAISASAGRLNCHVCVGSLSSDCVNGIKSSMVVKECVDFSESGALDGGEAERSAPYLKRKGAFIESKCMSFISNYENGEKFVERGCGYIYPEVDVCEYLAALAAPLYECTSCGTSLCNHDVL